MLSEVTKKEKQVEVKESDQKRVRISAGQCSRPNNWIKRDFVAACVALVRAKTGKEFIFASGKRTQ